MQAVILAGGAGTRLRPLTFNTPKPMIEINGQPFLSYIVGQLKSFGVKDFVFCVGYLADKFQAYFGDGSRFGVKIAYSVESGFMGTGGALKYAEHLLQDEFLVQNGDTYLPIDYNEAINAFRASGRTALLVIYNNQKKITEPNIAVDRNGKIVAYMKREALKQGNHDVIDVQKSNIPCQYIDAGAQVFKKRVLDLIPKNKFVPLDVEIFPALIKSGNLASFVTDQRYYDLGTPERLEAIKQVLR
ncbi:MAG: sugar phosphate nucleotidyltransferase [bacterium]